jgi:hypothetical protein
LKEVENACKKGGIERFETPQRVKVVTEAWTPETGLVTDALKLKRKAIEQKYKDEIEDLYEAKQKPKQDSGKKNKSKSSKDQENEKKSSKDESTTEKCSKKNPTDVDKDIISNDDEKKKDQ